LAAPETMVADLGSTLAPWTLGALALAWIAILALWARQAKELSVIKNALKGGDGEGLEEILREHMASKARLEDENRSLRARVAGLESRAQSAMDKVGLVRYDAFDEGTGSTSFALALQNDLGDGVVLNSITGRQQVKVYCKAVSGGHSEHTLSPEEREAIGEARASGRQAGG
jgi:hypothetical protein